MAAMEAYGNIWLLRHDGGSPGNWVRIANVKSFNGPNAETSFNDSTDFDSVGGRREFRPGLIDPGSLDLTVNYKPGAQTWDVLREQQRQRKQHLFRLVSCDADEGTRESEEFSAYVQSIGRSAEVDGFMEGTINLRITGDTNENAVAYPTINLTLANATIGEAGGVANFVAELSWADGKDTEVALTWTGTATSPDDYTRPAAATVIIPAGETSVAIPVTIVDDASVEGDETIILTIAAEIDGETLLTTAGGALARTLTITDNDS